MNYLVNNQMVGELCVYNKNLSNYNIQQSNSNPIYFYNTKQTKYSRIIPIGMEFEARGNLEYHYMTQLYNYHTASNPVYWYKRNGAEYSIQTVSIFALNWDMNVNQAYINIDSSKSYTADIYTTIYGYGYLT